MPESAATYPQREFVFQVYRATSNREHALDYVRGHKEVMKRFNIESLASSEPKWMTNENVYAILVFENGEIIAGAKIHKADGVHPLPVEDAVGYLDERLNPLIDADRQDAGTGEFCGMWTSKKVSGMGLSKYITRVAITILEQLEIKHLWGLTSDHTYPLFKAVGYQIIKDLGEGGDFAYPPPDYLAWVIKADAVTLEGADRKEEADIRNLRSKLEQTIQERTKDGVAISLKFQLVIK